jgi:hypothetical protein
MLINVQESVGVRLEPIVLLGDECDRCRAQAYVKVAMLKGNLLFCNHHYHEHELALISVSIGILDSRDLINS